MRWDDSYLKKGHFALVYFFFPSNDIASWLLEDHTLVTCDKYLVFISGSRHPHARDSAVIRDRDKLTTTEAQVLARRDVCGARWILPWPGLLTPLHESETCCFFFPYWTNGGAIDYVGARATHVGLFSCFMQQNVKTSRLIYCTPSIPNYKSFQESLRVKNIFKFDQNYREKY